MPESLIGRGSRRGSGRGWLRRESSIESIRAQSLTIRRQVGMPVDREGWHRQAIQFYRQGRYDEAISSYDQAIALDPEDAAAWYGRGVVLRDLHRINEALAAF